ncbi:hypothetical protein GCM10025298_27900 [Natronobiforma cellulositropha]
MGTIVLGGGAALGSGAFSSVTAERSVTVHVEEDDAGALIGLVPNGDSAYVRTDSDGVFEIDLASLGDINVDATVTITDAFTLENNAGESLDISFELVESDGSAVTDFELTFVGSSGEFDSITLGSNESEEDIDILVETSTVADEFDVELRITATPTP